MSFLSKLNWGRVFSVFYYIFTLSFIIFFPRFSYSGSIVNSNLIYSKVINFDITIGIVIGLIIPFITLTLFIVYLIRKKTIKNEDDFFSQEIINTLPYGVLMIDDNLNVVKVNDKVLSILKKSSLKEIVNKKCYEVLFKNDEKCPYCLGEICLQENKNQSNVVSYLRDNGVKFTARINAFPLSSDKFKNNSRKRFFVKTVEDLSDSVSSLDIIKDKKEKLDLAVFGANIGYWVYHIKTGEVFTSELSHKILGYNNEEMSVNIKEREKFVHLEDLKKLRVNLENHLKGFSQFYEAEYRVKTKDGNWKWILSKGRIVEWDEKGRPLRMAGTHLDIDGRKKAEYKLKESELKFDQILNNSRDILYRINLVEMKFDYASSSFTELSGYKIDDFIDLSVHELYDKLIHPDDIEMLKRQLDNVKNSADYKHKSFVLEYRVKYNNGRYHWWSDSHSIILDDKGAPAYIIGNIRDITEIKAAQEKLKETENRFEELFKNHSAIMYLVDPEDLNIIDVNDAALKYYGYSRDEIVGKKLTEINTLKENELRNILFNALGQDYNVFLFKHKLSDGVIRDVEIHITPVKIQKDREIYFTIVNDVTERNELELEREVLICELENALLKAEESNKLKTEFLAMLSHELRTPLSAMLGFSQLLENDVNLDDKQREYAVRIHRSGIRLLDVLNDLLEISVIEAGKVKIQYSSFNIANLINDIYVLFDDKIQEKNLDFKINLNDIKTIYSDPSRLRQILFNLIGNAIKFTKNGEIEIILNKIDDNYIFKIRDTGIGIAGEDINEIFDMFKQVENIRNRHYGGTGLGLSICRKLINALNGKIWVESEINKGSVFYFEIPVLKPELLHKTGYSEPDKYNDKTKIEDKVINVLFLENDDINVKLMSETFDSNDNFCYKACREKNELINELSHNILYDVVLVIIEKKDLENYNIVKEIKMINEDIPIIALTPCTLNEDILKIKQMGVKDIVKKPFNINNLYNLIQKYKKIR